jgi:hypothetical protein
MLFLCSLRLGLKSPLSNVFRLVDALNTSCFNCPIRYSADPDQDYSWDR